MSKEKRQSQTSRLQNIETGGKTKRNRETIPRRGLYGWKLKTGREGEGGAGNAGISPIMSVSRFF